MFASKARLAAELKLARTDQELTHDLLEDARRSVEAKSAMIADLQQQLDDLHTSYMAARADVDEQHSINVELSALVERMNRNWESALSAGAVPAVVARRQVDGPRRLVHTRCGDVVDLDESVRSDGDPDYAVAGEQYYFAVCHTCDEDLFSFECEPADAPPQTGTAYVNILPGVSGARDAIAAMGEAFES